MAEIQQNSIGSRRHAKRVSRSAPRLDMTPMVDLAFLLLTFFVLAANLVLPKSIEMITPKTSDDKTHVSMERAITLLLDETNPSKVWFYNGKWSDETKMAAASLDGSGLREMLVKRNAKAISTLASLKADYASGKVSAADYAVKRSKTLNSADSPFIIIKTTDNASYGKLVDVLDEISVSKILQYSFADPTDEELLRMKENK